MNKRKEPDLVISCCPLRFPPKLQEAARRIVDQFELDWGYVAEFVVHHGVAGPFLHNLEEAGLASYLPAEPRARIIEATERRKARTIDLLHEMTQIEQAFKRCGVQSIVLKGPAVLAVLGLFDRLELRPFWDLDFLVTPQSVEEASRVLSEMGYLQGYFDPDRKAVFAASQRDIEEARFYRHHKRFLRYDPDASRLLVIEIHQALHDVSVSRQSPLDALFKKATSYPIGNTEFRTYAVDCLLLHLCAHLHNHFTSLFDLVMRGQLRLKYLLDIKNIVDAQGRNIDQSGFVKLADELGLTEPTVYGLYQAGERFGGTEFMRLLEGFPTDRSFVHDVLSGHDGRVPVQWDIPMLERLQKSLDPEALRLHVKGLLAAGRSKRKDLAVYVVNRAPRAAVTVQLENPFARCSFAFAHDCVFLYFVFQVFTSNEPTFDCASRDWIRQSCFELVVDPAPGRSLTSYVFLLRNTEYRYPIIYDASAGCALTTPATIEASGVFENGYTLSGRIPLERLGIDLNLGPGIGADVRYIDWDDGVRLLGWSGKHVQSNINAFEIGQFVFE